MIEVDFQSMITISSRRSEGPTADAVSEGTEGKPVVGLPNFHDSPDPGWLVAIVLGKIFPSLTHPDL